MDDVLRKTQGREEVLLRFESLHNPVPEAGDIGVDSRCPGYATDPLAERHDAQL